MVEGEAAFIWGADAGCHGGGGSFHGGGSYGGDRGIRGGGFDGGARSLGGGSHYPGSGLGTRRSAGSSGERSSGSRSSNVRGAINDGQWHSFGNAGSSARLSEGRNSGGLANSSLAARNAGSSDATGRFL